MELEYPRSSSDIHHTTRPQQKIHPMKFQLVPSRVTGCFARCLEVHCEALERRRMLAGNVNANINGAGDLVISGDNAANEIAVEIADDGTVSVVGYGGTTVDLGNLGTEKVERNVRVTLRGGDDMVTIVGTGASVPVRDVIVNTGADNDSVGLSQLYGIQRDVQVITGAGDDMVAIEYLGIGRNLTIKAANGDKVLSVEDTVVAEEEALGRLRISSTSGDDTVAVRRSSVYGSVDVNSGAGNDRIEMEDAFAIYGKGLNVRSGSGNDEIYLTGSGTIVQPDSGKYSGHFDFGQWR